MLIFPSSFLSPHKLPRFLQPQMLFNSLPSLLTRTSSRRTGVLAFIWLSYGEAAFQVSGGPESTIISSAITCGGVSVDHCLAHQMPVDGKGQVQPS